ncbi:ATP-binding protein [Brevirhabdus sp.]|uniref:ATP-binding protein n=1 Tax=Brevirhabdus sp. TaxID=2004514 RepID=UPI0040589C0D
MRPRTCDSVAAFADALSHDLAMAVLTEDAVHHADLSGIARFLHSQPPWSSLPFILLTRHGGGPERNPEAARLSELLENVTFLERPFHATTFISLATSALRSRIRQFEARNRIAQLRTSEENLRTALRAGKLEPWEMRLGGDRIEVSPSINALFGWPVDEPLGLAQMLAIIHHADRAPVTEMFHHSGAADRDFKMEVRLVWGDGSLHWIDIHARVTHPPDGAARLMGVMSDITVRKQAEATLRGQNEDLEQRVRDRTAELEQAHKSVLDEIAQREQTEGQLRQAQKMEMIGQLTGGMAHDFNNLLMAVIGNLDLLQKHLPDDPRAQRLITGAVQGAQRGATLTQRLLAFARRQDLTIQPLDPVELIRGSAELMTKSVGDEISLRFELPETAPLTLIDGTQLDLALLNLVVNARDAMPEGGSITLSAHQASLTEAQEEAAPGDYVVLSVTDTGVGMDEETLKQATQPFFSTKELGKGTGLGLAMIQGLAQQMHGALRLFSTPGEGTRAELWLPVAPETAPSAPPAPDPVPAAPPDAAPAQPHRALRILLVDDDVLIAMSSMELLEDLGHEVTGVYSGTAALKVLNDGKTFDLMITDFSMPRMNGGQLSKAVRQMHPQLPILLATGYAELPDDDDLDLPRLAKPYMQHQLEAEINKLVG